MIIVGDLNIHVDSLSGQDLCQNVDAPTQCQGHTFDLFITSRDQSVCVLPIDLPLLSDHSFVVAHVGCTLLRRTSIGLRNVSNRRVVLVCTAVHVDSGDNLF